LIVETLDSLHEQSVVFALYLEKGFRLLQNIIVSRFSLAFFSLTFEIKIPLLVLNITSNGNGPSGKLRIHMPVFSIIPSSQHIGVG
jgi:hypothetical protein